MNIKISKIAHRCAACEAEFVHDQVLTSAVRVVEGLLIREDHCAECWTATKDKKAYSVWKTVYYDPKIEENEAPEVFSPLRQLFYEAAEEDSRVEMAKAFLAAGLLRRQKVFRRIKESDESDGEIRITLYTDRIGNRLIEVPDPQFSYAEMEEARNLLLIRLQELEAPAEKEGDEKGVNQEGVDGEIGPTDGEVEADSKVDSDGDDEEENDDDDDGAEDDDDDEEEFVDDDEDDEEEDGDDDDEYVEDEETAHAQA